MYPFLRMAKELVKFRNAPPLTKFETHVSHHICWPWDLDFWAELNNGRTLTLYDLGRVVLAQRAGLLGILRQQKWGLTVAGSSVRYRRRIRMFDRFEMRSRLVGWDDRFIYLEQSMWRGETCTSNLLIRSAFTDQNGIVPVVRVLDALGYEGVSPDLPDWIKGWIASENLRPWPPMQDGLPYGTQSAA